MVSSAAHGGDCRLSPNERFEASDEQKLKGALRDALGSDVTLRMEGTHYISGDRSGKFTSCLSAVSAAQGEA